MKWRDSTFNAQSSRVITVIVQVRASENIRSSSGGAEAKGNRGGGQNRLKLSLPQKMVCFSEFHRPLNAYALFCRFFFDLTRCWIELRFLVLCVPDVTETSNNCQPDQNSL